MKPKKVVVNNLMQKNYIYYLTEPVGKNFHSDFNPELTPKEMLGLGIFGGVYMRDCYDEYPKDWFEGAKFAKGRRDKSLNFFGVNASQSLKVWREKGWIREEDPRGWFEWYCRYYMGRRSEDDLRQIKRWRAIFRHVGAIKKNCLPQDWNCRRKQRQALLHWAIDSRNI